MRNDAQRLAELQRLMVLDTSPERDYDVITRHVASMLDVPIAMVNLLDRERDWFKSCVGLAQAESAAATSFCDVFFASDDDLIVVPDTQQDPRFAAHPLVTQPPFVRFYAAARLAVNGQTLGTLCAYDLKPRAVTDEQMQQVQVLASAVVDLLRRRSPPST